MLKAKRDQTTYLEGGVRPLQIQVAGPRVRVGSIPNQISVERAEWVIDRLRDRRLPYHFVLAAVPGFDRHSVFNREHYYASPDQIQRLYLALEEHKIDVAVLALPEWEEPVAQGFRLAAMMPRLEASYALVTRKNRQIVEGSQIGVFSYALARQLRAFRPQYHYERRVYSYEQGLQWVRGGQWHGVVIPTCDLRLGQDIDDLTYEPLPIQQVVPGVGQGGLVLITRAADESLSEQIYEALHDEKTAQRHQLERQLEQGLILNRERPGCCLWLCESQWMFSVYNPHLQRPFQRWAHQQVGDLQKGFEPELCYRTLQQVMGRLTLLGMGPGSPHQLTAAGEQILKQTERLFARNSQAEQLYYLLPAHCQLCDIESQRTLYEPSNLVNTLQKTLCEGHNTTVLLHGDGLLFSRGGTLARALMEAKIPFSFSPGLNLAVCGASMAGVPLLLPGVAPALHLFDARDPLLSEQAFSALKGTLAFSTNRRQLPVLVEQLIEQHQLSPDQSALYLQEPGEPNQTKTTASLQAFLRPHELGIEENTQHGLLIIGDVVSYQARFQANINQGRPLVNRTLLIPLLRDLETQEIAAKTRWEEAGAHVIQLRLSVLRQTETGQRQLAQFFNQLRSGKFKIPTPTRRTETVSAGQKDRDRRNRVGPPPEGQTWIAFLTPEAVTTCFKTLRQIGGDLRHLARCSIAAASERVYRALAAEGIQAELVSKQQSSEDLGLLMRSFLTPQDQVVVMRAQGEGGIFESILSQAKLPFWPLGIYEQMARLPDRAQLLRLLDEADDLIFLSAASVDGFSRAMVRAELGHDAWRDRGLRLLAADEEIAEDLVARGYQVAGDLSLLEGWSHPTAFDWKLPAI